MIRIESCRNLLFIRDADGISQIAGVYRIFHGFIGVHLKFSQKKDRHTLFEVIDEPGGVTHSDHSNLTTSSTRVSACPEKRESRKNKQK